MDSGRKKMVAAGAVAVLAVAGGGAAVAATKVWSPKAESQAVITDAAGQLGVTPSQLSDALKKALKDRVDAAVAAGRLTQAQGDALKQRIDSGNVPFLFGGFGYGGGWGGEHFGLFGHIAGLDAAASYLGLTRAELQTQLEGGKTLAQIAKDQGKSVSGLVQALVASANQKIDAAVADGRLTQSQADQLKAGLETRITDLVNGQHDEYHSGFRRPGFGFRMPGADGFHGPQA